MKGFLIVCVLAAVTLGWKWVYARLMAKRDPVDAGALKGTNFPGGDTGP